jgi:hypothetical protein
LNPVTGEFLLTVAAIAATLIGLLLVGGLFYVETGFRGARTMERVGAPFLRSTIKLTLMLYAFSLAPSLALVVLRPPWLAVTFAVAGAVLLAPLVEWTRAYRELRRTVPVPRSSPWIACLVVAAMLALPWALEGWEPGREAVTGAILLAGALAVASTADPLLTSFELSRWESAARGAPAGSDEDDTGSGGGTPPSPAA